MALSPQGEGLGDDQSSLVEAGVGDGREQRDGGDDGEKLLHVRLLCSVLTVLTKRCLGSVFQMRFW